MSHRELEAYFRRVNADRIIPKIEEKETPTMFEQLKTHFLSLWTKPVQFVEEPIPPTVVNEADEEEDGYWSFEMFTPEWQEWKGDIQESIHTVHREPHEGTWMGVLDTILDKMEAHYGYNIKEQVYYSVAFPLNIEGEAGYGRCLNDEVLQQLLLAYPEVYEVHPSMQFLMEKHK